MSIVLFAIIGATINASAAYWVCFGIFCAFKVFNAAKEAIKEMA